MRERSGKRETDGQRERELPVATEAISQATAAAVMDEI